MIKIDGNACHDGLGKTVKQALAFRKEKDYAEWKTQIKEKFIELTGYDLIKENACPLQMTIEKDEQKDGYRLIRFVFESEKNTFVPCYLLIPDTGKKKYPVAIVLQGHTTGFHNSIGEIHEERDKKYHPQDEFALQAVKNGYIALAIEQRGMGERLARTAMIACEMSANIAFILGRTLLAERAWDVSRAIDLLDNFPECDTDKILITGNSGGGTASFYSACLEERIKLCVPSCSFCAYQPSIMSVYHCSCNYIPKAYRYFEMEDLSCMIAPRPLTIITGEKDDIFPIEGVKKSYETVKEIYAKEGAEENCELVVTSEGHFWCEDIVWSAINKKTKQLGW